METTFEGKPQLVRTKTVACAAPAVWAILAESRLLPRWARVVREVESCDALERVGAVRRCRVEMNGRPGSMVERCIELEPGAAIGYLVDDESFGMRRRFAHYGFRIALEPLGAAETRVRLTTFYTPRGPLPRLLNAVLIRPQLGRVVDGLLDGLAQLAEAR